MDVYFLLLPDVHLLDMAGPVQAIHECNELHGGFFRPRFVGLGASVNCWQGPAIGNVEPLPETVTADSLIFVCGMKLTPQVMAAARDSRLTDWLNRADRLGATLVGICTGTFVLGEAGLLDDRQCTTHHRLLQALNEAFPKARVTRERIFVEDGNLLTSAGVTAGIDLTLYLIARLRGCRVAIDTARELVVHNRRMGEDPQISEHLRHHNHVSPLIHEVQDHMVRAFREPLTVSGLAAAHRVSTRHLQRLFKASTGISIKGYLTALRLEKARELLADGRDSIELVAEKSGFQSTRAFREAWMRKYDTAPSLLRGHPREQEGRRPDAP
ncbi:transcriptional regulator, AraC family with amidase-like domain [Marinobacter daqiaonensis]|uniref:Transcriptional regulator, AraC family with amidase-like domain n=1 Tax=Marinobacter daqiaonensis TaxID=650891 RepID=A0A1I6GU73_9GAMM|nr:helix-turn-helix domain-containing protein [Marinobacter daqiaonensis]SFR45823.1 transcriptional regulator, AraC family with amidase-like domain [Marinobacter daqiaonensis]